MVKNRPIQIAKIVAFLLFEHWNTRIYICDHAQHYSQHRYGKSDQ